MFRRESVPKAIVVAAAAAIAAVAAIGQTTGSKPTVMRGPDYPSPYDNSTADRALKAFDEKNPECALWSDWHKLCSRTGPGGSTYCRTDPSHPVNASTPFCARSSTSYLRMRPAELKSRDRFRIPGRKNEYTADRPFNGSTVQAIDHPLCKEWVAPGHGESMRPDPKRVVFSDVKRATLSPDDYPFECQTFNRPPPCQNIVTGETFRNRDTEFVVETARYRIKNSPVIGLYCR